MKTLITETTKDFNPTAKAITYSVLAFIATSAILLIVNLAIMVAKGEVINFQY